MRFLLDCLPQLEQEVDGVSGGTSTVTASIDPYFFIPSTDPNAGEYSIILSPGIGNAPLSTIPEPSTWAMMLLGFAGLGFLGLRSTARRRAAG